MKCTYNRNYPKRPLLWNSQCTTAVKNCSCYFQRFRASHSHKDFLIYQKIRTRTTKVLRKAKRVFWKKFCTNLDPSTLRTEFWTITKKFKNYINQTSGPTNDNWFEYFYNEIPPSYVPSEVEVSTEVSPILEDYPILNPLFLLRILIVRNYYLPYHPVCLHH